MQKTTNIDLRNSFVKLYFYITPVFILIDYIFGINIRVAALDSAPTYKILYYGFCILCGVCIFIIPRYSAVVALFESTINIIMLVVGFFLQYMQTITGMMDDVIGTDFKAVENSLTFESITNFAIVGSCLLFTFHKSINTIAESFGYDGSDSKKIH
ncbi:MAG: hypothetical protein ACYS17_10280 [Planctomycetota bacterium]|jgi:hypothetical protein